MAQLIYFQYICINIKYVYNGPNNIYSISRLIKYVLHQKHSKNYRIWKKLKHLSKALQVNYIVLIYMHSVLHYNKIGNLLKYCCINNLITFTIGYESQNMFIILVSMIHKWLSSTIRLKFPPHSVILTHVLCTIQEDFVKDDSKFGLQIHFCNKFSIKRNSVQR